MHMQIPEFRKRVLERTNLNPKQGDTPAATAMVMSASTNNLPNRF